LESHDRLALDTRIRQQYGLRLERLGLFRVRIFGIRIFVRVGGDQRLLCCRVERDRGVYGRHDGQ
jgi:mRNA-degrading endonuclease RelE of RelBE toxin-antitoxin system